MDSILQETREDTARLDRFCSHPLFPGRVALLNRVSADSNSELRKLVRDQAPRNPGVYGMIDAIGRLIYVGKSKALRNRLLSYFLPNNEIEKAGRIIQSTVEIVWEKQPNEFAALLREQCLIRHYEPRYNVQGQPKRQRPVFLCLGHPPAELFYLSRTYDPDAIACVGPLSGAKRVRRAVEILNRTFRLRDCSNKTKFSFSDQLSLFELDRRPKCFRYEIATCLGPCIEACSRKEYDRQVQLAKQFLEGDTRPTLDAIQASMLQAAKGLHFEYAAKLYDDLKTLEWINNRINVFKNARAKYNFAYPVLGCHGAHICYLIRSGNIVGAIRFSKGRWSTARERLLELSAHFDAGVFRVDVANETCSLVSSWFTKFPDERKRVFPVDRIPEQWPLN